MAESCEERQLDTIGSGIPDSQEGLPTRAPPHPLSIECLRVECHGLIQFVIRGGKDRHIVLAVRSCQQRKVAARLRLCKAFGVRKLSVEDVVSLKLGQGDDRRVAAGLEENESVTVAEYEIDKSDLAVLTAELEVGKNIGRDFITSMDVVSSQARFVQLNAQSYYTIAIRKQQPRRTKY